MDPDKYLNENVVYARKIPLSDLLVTDKLQQHFLHEDLVYYTKGRGPGLFLTKH